MGSSAPVPAKLVIHADTQAKLVAWQDSIKKDALEIMQVKVPEKVLALNERIARMNTDAQDIFVKDHYYNTDALGIDVTVTYPAENETSTGEEALPLSKKRKAASSTTTTTTGSTSNKKSASVNGDASLSAAAAADSDSNEGASSAAHVFRGQIKANEYLTKAFDELRKEWDDLVTYMDAIKMFINLQFPKIEDGDTFGQSVQEEVLGEVVRSQDSAYNLLHTPANYFSVRGDLAAKVVRFPGIEDHVHALREHDRRVFYRIRLQFSDMRNTYAVVLDLLVKNMEKIAKPKSGNQMGSYG